MATRSQPHGTRWLEFGSIQMIKAVCTVATITSLPHKVLLEDFKSGAEVLPYGHKYIAHLQGQIKALRSRKPKYFEGPHYT